MLASAVTPAMLTLALVTNGVVAGSPGDLDQTFGGDGTVEIARPDGIFGDDIVVASARAPGGGLWAGSNIYDPSRGGVILLARLLEDGSLDSRFADSGRLVFSLREGDHAATQFASVAAAPHGGVQLSGAWYARDATRQVFVARFLRTGELDRSYGSGGITTWPYPARGASTDVVSAPAWGASTSSDGSQLLCAMSFGGKKAHVWRARPDGSKDADFGHEGSVVVRNRHDGNVLQGCGQSPADGATLLITNDSPTLELIRLSSDGEPDDGFGEHGYVFYRTPQNVSARSPAFLPDGGLAIAGRALTDEGFRPSVLKLLPDGSTDARYGNGDGLAVATAAELAGSGDGTPYPTIGVGAHGEIVLAGRVVDSQFDVGAFVAEFTRLGEPDVAFGTDGAVVNLFTEHDANPTSAFFDAQRRVVVGATSGRYMHASEVARLLN